MRKNVSPLQRLMATTLSVFLTVGLGLIGSASALADGVERGGLSFTIVSDEISKTANGSVPLVAGTDLAGLESGLGGGGGGRDTVSGAATTAGEDGTEPTPVLASTTTSGTGNSGKGTDSGTDSGTGDSDYNTSNTFSDKNETNKTTGKKAYAKW